MLPSPPPIQWWVKEFSLREQDRLVLVNGEWLNDLHISAAQQILKMEFQEVGSLQSTLLGLQLKFQPIQSKAAQIVNFNGHWVCVSTIGCGPGHVNVYDSLYSATPPALVKQLCCLLQTKEKQLTINVMEMQAQSGGNDCGCFAIACATALCHGENPSTLVWSQTKIRGHLHTCLSKRKMQLFPAKKKAQHKLENNWIKKSITVPVFCCCRGPADRKGMLQCAVCLKWCHKKCCNIPATAFKKNVVWKCPSCKH